MRRTYTPHPPHPPRRTRPVGQSSSPTPHTQMMQARMRPSSTARPRDARALSRFTPTHDIAPAQPHLPAQARWRRRHTLLAACITAGQAPHAEIAKHRLQMRVTLSEYPTDKREKEKARTEINIDIELAPFHVHCGPNRSA
ncbi:hypothetical protein DFH09DRAFT_1342161 [Mycena vulgaris]|nr:hypothetical protein DFH09DRAFT_1342161 [Mycena vulgaris]